MNNKTLIILIPGFPANEEDSACVPFPQSFVKNLKRLNPSLNIIVLAFQYPFFKSVYTWNGCTVYSFNGRNRGQLSRVLLWLSVIRKMKRIIRENEVMGVLNFWLGECAMVAGYVSGKYKLKSFSWLMGQDAKKNNRYVRFIKPTSVILIALSDFIAGEFYRNYKIKPANIVPLGIDKEMFAVTSSERNIDILGAGSLIPLKRYEQFIKIIAELVASGRKIKAVICGDGPERFKLEQLINDLGLSDVIELQGELDHSEVLKRMQAAKIFLHTSLYEGFSTVCAEALYAGAHVISYCQPMDKHFDHWHIAKTESEIKTLIINLLDESRPDHSPVLTYPIEETCEKIMALYK